MSDLMKKVFNDKQYQFGFNDAMDVAFNNERELKAKVEELTAENADSKREAESLAMALWRRHYQETSPDFELCNTTAGVITQIDNMTAGVIQNNENQCAVIKYLQAKVEELTAANNDAYSRGWVDALAEEYQQAGWVMSGE